MRRIAYPVGMPARQGDIELARIVARLSADGCNRLREHRRVGGGETRQLLDNTRGRHSLRVVTPACHDGHPTSDNTRANRANRATEHLTNPPSHGVLDDHASNGLVVVVANPKRADDGPHCDDGGERAHLDKRLETAPHRPRRDDGVERKCGANHSGPCAFGGDGRDEFRTHLVAVRGKYEPPAGNLRSAGLDAFEGEVGLVQSPVERVEPGAAQVGDGFRHNAGAGRGVRVLRRSSGRFGERSLHSRRDVCRRGIRCATGGDEFAVGDQRHIPFGRERECWASIRHGRLLWAGPMSGDPKGRREWRSPLTPSSATPTAIRPTPRAPTWSRLRRSLRRQRAAAKTAFVKAPDGCTYANAFSAVTSAAATTRLGATPLRISIRLLIRSCDPSNLVKTGHGASSTPSSSSPCNKRATWKTNRLVPSCVRICTSTNS